MELPSALGNLRHGVGVSDALASSQYCGHQLTMAPSVTEGIRCVLPIGEGGIITGGYDKYIRIWDGVDPKRSFPMCGPTPRNPYSDTQVGQTDQAISLLVCFRMRLTDMIFSIVVTLRRAFRLSTSAACRLIFNVR